MAGALIGSSEGHTLILTLSNPQLNNALGPDMYAAGIEALNAAEANPEIRSVVISGEGQTFCTSAGMQSLQTRAHDDLAAREFQIQNMEGLHNWIDSIRTYPKPVIAAVEGNASDAGFSLALACDFVVAASNAVFQMTRGADGLSPEGGSSWHLARALPRALTSELLMCGEPIDAQRLHSFGVVNKIVAPGEALKQALQLSTRLNACAPHALASIKELISEAPANTLGEQLLAEQKHFVRNLHTANPA